MPVRRVDVDFIPTTRRIPHSHPPPVRAPLQPLCIHRRQHKTPHHLIASRAVQTDHILRAWPRQQRKDATPPCAAVPVPPGRELRVLDLDAAAGPEGPGGHLGAEGGEDEDLIVVEAEVDVGDGAHAPTAVVDGGGPFAVVEVVDANGVGGGEEEAVGGAAAGAYGRPAEGEEAGEWGREVNCAEDGEGGDATDGDLSVSKCGDVLAIGGRDGGLGCCDGVRLTGEVV